MRQLLSDIALISDKYCRGKTRERSQLGNDQGLP